MGARLCTFAHFCLSVTYYLLLITYCLPKHFKRFGLRVLSTLSVCSTSKRCNTPLNTLC